MQSLYRPRELRDQVQIAIEVLLSLLQGNAAPDLPVIENLRTPDLRAATERLTKCVLPIPVADTVGPVKASLQVASATFRHSLVVKKTSDPRGV